MNISQLANEAGVRTGDSLAQKRAQIRAMWAKAAPNWAQHADYVDQRAAGITNALLRLAAPQPGEHVLEVACGPGGLGIAASSLVGAGGHVVLSDVAPEMLEIATRRVREAGLTNVSLRLRDIEDLDETDRSFDIVLCREGLMFALDPVRAVGEIRRVLRPGGRVALAVWGPRARNPWLGVILDCVSAQVGRPLPPPGMPGPFALEDSNRFADVLKQGGLANVTVTELLSPLRTNSFDEWLMRTSALAGPIASALSMLPAPAIQALRLGLREAVTAYETPAGLDFPGVTLIASGCNP